MTEVRSVNDAVLDADGDLWIQLDAPGEVWYCVTGSVEPVTGVQVIEEEFGIADVVKFVGPATEIVRVGTECCEHCGAMGHSRSCPAVVGDARVSAERSDQSKSSCGSAEERSDDPSKASDLGEVS